jgi:hypothetical protein
VTDELNASRCGRLPAVFERFTERAREVVVLAQDEAHLLGHGHVGTEHLLLGLVREGEGVAARVLAAFDVTEEAMRAQVAAIVGHGDEATSGALSFTPSGTKALARAWNEALLLGHTSIDTQHILLGLLRVKEGVAARILLDFDADADKVRTAVARLVSKPRQPDTDTPFTIRCPRCGQVLDERRLAVVEHGICTPHTKALWNAAPVAPAGTLPTTSTGNPSLRHSPTRPRSDESHGRRPSCEPTSVGTGHRAPAAIDDVGRRT